MLAPPTPFPERTHQEPSTAGRGGTSAASIRDFEFLRQGGSVGRLCALRVFSTISVNKKAIPILRVVRTDFLFCVSTVSVTHCSRFSLLELLYISLQRDYTRTDCKPSHCLKFYEHPCEVLVPLFQYTPRILSNYIMEGKVHEGTRFALHDAVGSYRALKLIQ